MKLKKLLKCIKYDGEQLCIRSAYDFTEYNGNLSTIKHYFPKLLERKVRGITVRENMLYIGVD